MGGARLLIGVACLGGALGCAALAGLTGDYEVGVDGHSDGGASSTGASGSGTGATGPGASGGGAGGPGGSGPGGNTTGGGSSTGGTSGTGGNGTGGAGPGGAGGSPIGSFQVSCAGVPCAVGQVCCAVGNPGSGDNTQLGCAAQGTCGPGEFEIVCDGSEDCPGAQVCCGRSPGNHYTAVECTTANDCLSPDYVMCIGPAGPTNADCVNGGTCNASGDLSGYYYCG